MFLHIEECAAGRGTWVAPVGDVQSSQLARSKISEDKSRSIFSSIPTTAWRKNNSPASLDSTWEATREHEKDAADKHKGKREATN